MRRSGWAVAVAVLGFVTACGATQPRVSDPAVVPEAPNDAVTDAGLAEGSAMGDPEGRPSSIIDDPAAAIALQLDGVISGKGWAGWVIVGDVSVESDDSASVSLAVDNVLFESAPAEVSVGQQVAMRFDGSPPARGDRVLLVVHDGVVVLRATFDGTGVVKPDRRPYSSETLGWAADEFITHISQLSPSRCVEIGEVVAPSTLDEAVVAYLMEATPRQQFEAERATVEARIGAAQRLVDEAEAAEPVDGVIGEPVPYDAAGALDALERGVPVEEVILTASVPVYVDTSGLETIDRYVFIGADGRYLGELDLGPTSSSGYWDERGDRAPFVESFISPAPDGFDVYRVDGNSLCPGARRTVEIALREGQRVASVPPGAVDDAHRVMIDPATGLVLSLDAVALEALRRTS